MIFNRSYLGTHNNYYYCDTALWIGYLATPLSWGHISDNYYDVTTPNSI